MLGAACLPAAASGGGGAADDVAVPPPGLEARRSPSGNHELEVRLHAGATAHAARSTATLFALGTAGRTVLWTRELPHRPRPRFFVVGDGGEVVLLDEWLNVRSALAVMLIARTNRTVAQHDLETVRAALGMPIGQLAPQARHGVWIQAPPQLGARGDTVEVPAAGRVLLVRLSDGALSVR